MARKNFQFEKFKREMAQQKKREEKRRQKQEQRARAAQDVQDVESPAPETEAPEAKPLP